MRAKKVIIPGEENPAELEALLRELFEDWKPEGHTERHLVEQIGLAEWRLRRVHRAELGETRTQMSSTMVSNAKAEIDHAFRHFPERVPQILRKSSAGIPYLRDAIDEAVYELEKEGTVSEDSCDRLEEVFGDELQSPASALRFWFLGEIPEVLKEALDSVGEPTATADKGDSDTKEIARNYLGTMLKDLDRQERKLRKQERIALEIARQRLSIPQGLELERIQRYETAIKREMRRDIDQLERLQRRRIGEPLPPTVNVNVSKDE
ncbi:MAG: hypothetical protein WCA22_07450 [Candidatus Binatus sp.]